MSADRSSPDQPSGGPAQEALLAVRRSFCRLTDGEVALLADLRPAFERHADQVVASFYEHLQRYDALRPFLADERTVRRLTQLQRGYMLSLCSEDLDDAYAENRLSIGRSHERIGLLPQWFLGTYGLYVELLIPIVHEHYAADPSRAVRASVALTKRILLDAQIVLDAYHGLRQKKAVERSEQLAAVGQLAASIAHEVRNPLAGMKGALEVLHKRLEEPQNREVLDEVLGQITRMEGLVRDLLSYARPRPLARQALEVHELIDRLLKQYRERMDEASITVQRIWGPGSDRLDADPQQMEQVFLNLLQNAVQAMEEGGTLTVSTRADPGELVLSFQDTGRGIPADVLPQVFTPFFTTKHRGSGLGLAIVKKIVEEHGGRIAIESQPFRGTTVTIALPHGVSDAPASRSSGSLGPA